MSNLLEQASLVMIPSGYKEDIVYSEIPINGAGDLSFTRASDGTRINSAGLVEVAPWNLATDSENFSANYLEINSTISSNTTTAPNGTTTAESILETTATDVHAIRGDYTETSGIAYTYSVYAKTISGRNIQVLGSNGFTGPIARVNLSNGTLLSGSTGASVESVGNGWYRISITETTTTTSIRVIIYSMDGTATTFTGSTSNGIYIWGAQLNIGSTAKPYFPTTDRLNVPRLTYQNGGGGCPSLLLEKQSTNHCKWSNDLTQSSAWIDQTSNTTITQITSGGADGGSFTRLVSTGSGSQGRMVQAGSITNPNGATMSVYLKGSGTAGFGLFIGNGISQYNQITLTNTWTRYTVSVSGTGSTYQDWEIDCFGGSTIDVSFVQVEVSSYATSPIYTTSSSATRVADLASVPQGTIANFGTNPFCVFLDVNFVKLSSTGAIALLGNRQSGNWWRIYSNNQHFYFEINGSNGFANPIIIPNTAELLTRTKIAVNRNGNNLIAYVNGVQTQSLSNVVYSSDFTTGNSQIDFNSWNAGGYEITTTEYNEVVLFKQSLSTTELASLTTI